MVRFRVSLAVSLDGYIADAQGGVKWLDPFFTKEIDFPGFLATIGAVVMGRTTYDQTLTFGHGGGAATPSFVLTHRALPADTPKHVEAFSGDLTRLAARLRKTITKDVWLMGGGVSLDSCRRAGIVDRWELSFIPVLLGTGLPLFPPGAAGIEALRLVHTRALTNGILEAHYEPRPSPQRPTN